MCHFTIANQNTCTIELPRLEGVSLGVSAGGRGTGMCKNENRFNQSPGCHRESAPTDAASNLSEHIPENRFNQPRACP